MGFTRVGAGDGTQLQDIADTFVSAKKVVMITGAGISTSCGIPDFRSQEGLYSLIKDAHGRNDPGAIGTKGKDLFDSNLWRDEASTQTFYKFISSLRHKIANDVKKTSATHKMIAKLKEQRKLVRCYTQNIDGLEAREGLSMTLHQGKGNTQRFGRKALGEVQSDATAAKGGIHHAGCEVVPLHGDLAELRCTVCSHHTAWTPERQEVMLSGHAPACPDCEEKDMIRTAMGRRGLKVGALRPDIVLYGENHPSTDSIAKITEADLKIKPDVLLVMGTSLKVHGLKALVREFAKAVHDKKGGKVIFVNLTEPAESAWKDVFDHWVEMDCDGWVKDMKRRRPQLWMTQTHLEPQLTKSASCASKKPPAKPKVAQLDQENMKPETETTVLSKPGGASIKGLKRTASAVDLAVPNTPKRRKPLQQIATPPSSRRQNSSARKRSAERIAFFERQENVATSEHLPAAPKMPNDSPHKAPAMLLTPEPTPSRRVHPKVRAALIRAKEPLLGAIDLTQASPSKNRRSAFSIFDDELMATNATKAMASVPDSEDETYATKNTTTRSAENQSDKLVWKEMDGDTIELVPTSRAMDSGTALRELKNTSTNRRPRSRTRSAGGILMAEAGIGVIGGKVQTGKRRGSCIAPSKISSLLI